MRIYYHRNDVFDGPCPLQTSLTKREARNRAPVFNTTNSLAYPGKVASNSPHRLCGMRQYGRTACTRTQKAFSKYIDRGFSYVGDLSESLKTKVGGPMFIPLDHRQSFDSSEHILRCVFAKGWAWMHFGMAEEDDKVQR